MAWNEPGNGQRDPWGRNRQPTGKSPLHDLSKQLRNLLGKSGKHLPGNLLAGVLVLLIVGVLLSSYTMIDARQVGVVLRLGRYSRTLEPGFHFKLPQPIEAVDKVDTTRVRSINDQLTLLTRDQNIVAVGFSVQYQVADARKYLFSMNDPDGTVQATAEAALRGAIGASSMNQVLSGTGSALVRQVQQAVQKAMDDYGSGIRVNEVSFQNIAPPKEVKDAFDDVTNASEDKQGAENAAQAYASKILPVARGEAARIAAEADGYRTERIARAEGDTARFNLILKAYRAAPEVTRRRMWLETMEKVLAGNPKVIDGSGGRNIINLPAYRSETPAAAPAPAGTVNAVVPSVLDTTGDANDKGKQP